MSKSMEQIFLIAILTITFCLPIFAQSDSCVTIESEGGAKVFVSNEPARLNAVFNKEISTIGAKYNWKLSAGKIISGENTDSILINLKDSGGQTITATVEFEGVAGLCSKTAAFTFDVARLPPMCSFDRWGNLTQNAVRARLDNLAVSLSETVREDSSFDGYITYTRSKNESVEDATTILKRMKRYLVKERGIPSDKIVLILFEIEENTSSTEIWIFSKKSKENPFYHRYILID